jgi:hypothetical protein
MEILNANGTLVVRQPSTGLWVPRYADAKVRMRLTAYFHHAAFGGGWEGVTRAQRDRLYTLFRRRDRGFVAWLRKYLGGELGMAGATQFLERELLDHVWGAAAYTAPATLYHWSSTTDPTNDGSGKTEPVGNGYARVGVTNNATNFPAAASGGPATKANGTAILWDEATDSWGNQAYIGQNDAASAGNDLAYGAVNGGTPLAVGTNQILRIPSGDLDLLMD